jgi:prophage regulatory protein
VSAVPRFGAASSQAMIALPRALSITGYGRSTFYAAMLAGLMPRPVKLGRKSVWPEDEIQALRAAVVRGDDDGARRALVRQLHVRRGLPRLRAV